MSQISLPIVESTAGVSVSFTMVIKYQRLVNFYTKRGLFSSSFRDSRASTELWQGSSCLCPMVEHCVNMRLHLRQCTKVI